MNLNHSWIAMTIQNDVYKYFPMIRHHVLSNSGSVMDAEDLFQEALIAIHLKPELVLTCKFSTYLYEVCRRLWLNELDSRQITLDYMDSSEPEDERPEFNPEIFERLTKRRQQVIKLSMTMPLSEVSEIMGCTYKSVKVKKYKALKQLRLLTKEKLSCKFVAN